jgi:hypothetical protein
MGKMPRIMFVTEYYSVPIDTGRGFTKSDLRERDVLLDTDEVEMIFTERNSSLPIHTVRTRSGREFNVSREDFDRIERAMWERE